MPERPLSVEMFKQLMHERDGKHEAQFNEMKALMGGLRETVEHLDEALSTRMDTANGRTTKLEELVEAVRNNGCAQLVAHRTTLTALSEIESTEEPRWHQKPAVRGGAAVGMFVLILEIIKELLTKRWF